MLTNYNGFGSNVQRQTHRIFVRSLAAFALKWQIIILQLLQIRNADGAGLIIGLLLRCLLRWLLRWLLHLYAFGFQTRENVGNVGGSAHVGTFGHGDLRRSRHAAASPARRVQIGAIGRHRRRGGVVPRAKRRARIRIGVTHAGRNRWRRRALVRNVGRRLSWRL